MKTFTKTLQVEDYIDLEPAVSQLRAFCTYMAQKGIKIGISHDHRFWEYGMAITAALKVLGSLKGKKVLDVGSGHGLLGPALAYIYEADVVEIDPNRQAVDSRVKFQRMLEREKKNPIKSFALGIEDMESLNAEKLYDAVFCISVLEHLFVDKQNAAWLSLSSRVADGGLLFLTVDCMPRVEGKYKWDELREARFTSESMKTRIKLLEASGFRPLGPPDYDYHGTFVNDYTFASIAMTRTNGMVTDIEL
jgi:SAM-dependent methyltransferase